MCIYFTSLLFISLYLHHFEKFALGSKMMYASTSQLRGTLVGVQVGRMGYVPAYGGNGSSRNVSCSEPTLHCLKRPWEGALYKRLKEAPLTLYK